MTTSGKRRNKVGINEVRECEAEECENEFHPKEPGQRYCSMKCWMISNGIQGGANAGTV